MADATNIIELAQDVYGVTQWLIGKAKSYKEFPGVHLSLQRISRRNPEKDFSQLTVAPFQELSNALENAKIFLENQDPKSWKDGFKWSLLNREEKAKDLLNTVEKAQNKLSIFLNLIHLLQNTPLPDPELHPDNFRLWKESKKSKSRLLTAPAHYQVDSNLPYGGKINVIVDSRDLVNSRNTVDSRDPVATIATRLKSLAGEDSLSYKSKDYSGILPFVGYQNSKLISLLPKNLKNPKDLQTLQEFIAKSEAKTAILDERFRLARQLSQALVKIHATGLVHRNLRCKNVLLLEPEEPDNRLQTQISRRFEGREAGAEKSKEEQRYPSNAKVEWEDLRGDQKGTDKKGAEGQKEKPDATNQPKATSATAESANRGKDPNNLFRDSGGYEIPEGSPSLYITQWDFLAKRGTPTAQLDQRPNDIRVKVYRHPKIQVKTPTDLFSIGIDAYSLGIDAYSLGVCLLEIGLWKVLIKFDKDDEDRLHPRPSTHFCTIAEEKPIASSGNEPADSSGNRPRISMRKELPRLSGQKLQDVLIETAERSLPKEMGKPYADFVVLCLRWLDDNSETELREWKQHTEAYLNFKCVVDRIFDQVNLGGGPI
ncbi:hypothetical protein A1O3_02695 [Capronia epimyces CBS 606.96]|uniref:Protein kinase domain-containing protein n=1 Tax=Capronia epimyces CBS 606.96 TaxID=1182542 RepID=W9YAS4_9EURO|nr:uncharacterized protein A1O3_02695 [Capronia epimyces CBS 606.96]EXJ89628.1 hypothetical protein A1O3_02695 [Capronia epimyces CBS 606.96]